MKSLTLKAAAILALTFWLSLVSAASATLENPTPAPVPPDLACQGSTGLRYAVHYRSFTEIIIYQGDEIVGNLDSMQALFRGKMLYYVHEEGDFVAAFRIRGKTAVGRVKKERVFCQLL